MCHHAPMRSLHLALLGAALNLPACNAVIGGGPCDQKALSAAADATASMLAAWRPDDGALPDYPKIAKSVQDACTGLPEGFRGYFELSVQPQPDRRSNEFPNIKPLHDDAEGLRPMRAHCPDHARIAGSMGLLVADERLPAMYDGCKFAEIGLIDRADIAKTLADRQAHHAHALFLWLVDVGAPREVAHKLVRPILASTDTRLEAARDLKLPASARGVPLSGDASLLHATPYQMTVDHNMLVNLKDGAYDEQYFEPAMFDGKFASIRELGRADSMSPRLNIAADVSLRWSVLGPALHAAWRAGFTELAVVALTPEPLQPLIAVPLVTEGPAAAATLTLSPARIDLQCAEHTASPDIAALPAELARCPGGLRLAVTVDTALPRIVELLAALAGKAQIVELLPPA